jgi:hypothetical protein
MSDIITLVYKHKHSAPSPDSPHASERHAPFSPSVSPADIFYARPSLFTWATNLVANYVHREIYELAAKDDDVHLRASTNGRRPMDSVNLVTWETLGKFSIAALVEKYKSRAPVAWHLTECMAGSRKNGVVVVKKQRPHPIVCILMESDISTSFTFSCRFKWALSAPFYLRATTLLPETLRWPWAYGTLRSNPISMSNVSTAGSEIL